MPQSTDNISRGESNEQHLSLEPTGPKGHKSLQALDHCGTRARYHLAIGSPCFVQKGHWVHIFESNRDGEISSGSTSDCMVWSQNGRFEYRDIQV
mmetsp:Transcript_27156/g.74127  ORF Transcript_27156/g.74127 Transcript_27156/m.74127 type:complete len:95 (-) Transcript_27156:1530-1814(-)